MSSNTLRGIGKKGADGDAAGGGSADGKPADKLADRLGKIAERREKGDGGAAAFNAADARTLMGTGLPAPEAAPARSLDSTIPGTRSLDASVPGAAPSLDAQFSRVTPPLAATLIGIPASKFNALKSKEATAAMPAPVPAAPTHHDSMANAAGRRDLGTVSGHDVHLPQELQRTAGVHATGAAVPSDGTPLVILGPGLTDEVTDPIAAPPETSEGTLRATDDLALGAHLPWYDQLPAAEEVYEDAKPNLIARIAVGAAAAAAAAVLVIAFVRMRGHGESAGQEVAETPPVVAPAPRAVAAVPPPAPLSAAPAVAPPPPAPVVAAAPPAPPPPAAPVATAPVPVPPAPVAEPAPKPAPPAPVAAAPAPTPPPPAVVATTKTAAAPAVTPKTSSPAERPEPSPAAEEPSPPKPVAAAPPRPPAKPSPAPPARPAAAVALRTGTPAARPAAPRLTAAATPAAPKSPRPTTAGPGQAARKAPIVAAASPPSGSARPTARARAADAPGTTPKRPDRSRQKLLTDPDSTLPLSLD